MLEDHDELRAIAAELRGLLSADRMPVTHRFATVRWTLTRRLLRHIAVEARVLPDLDASPFDHAYRNHIARWTPDRMDGDWPAYRREAGALLDTLERNMAHEERTFYKVRPVRPALQ